MASFKKKGKSRADSAPEKRASKENSPRSEKRLRLSDDLLWGVHPIYENLQQQSGNISEIILQKDRRGEKIEEIISLAKAAGIKLSFVESVKLTGEGSAQIRHQGIIARTTEAEFLDFTDFSKNLKARIDAGEPCRVIVLDSLQDPHNVGAIIRSAVASGAAGVLVTRERSAPLGGTAAKASAGAMAHIDICQVTNLVSALADLKKIGFWVFGAVMDVSATELYEADFSIPSCIVVGSEGKGIRPLVKKECDILVSIPMQGELDSLNCSVAAGVLLFEAMRQNLVAKK